MTEEPVWFAATPEGQLGPMTLGEIRLAYFNRRLPENAQVWRCGMPAWQPAHEVFSSGPPPLPSPPSPDPKPKGTIIFVMVIAVLGIVSSLLMIPTILSGEAPLGGGLYQALPELLTLAKVSMPFGLLTGLVLLVASLLAYRDHPVEPMALTYSVPAVALLSVLQSIVGAVWVVHSANWAHIPPTLQTNILVMGALNAIGVLLMWGVVYWRLTRRGWHQSAFEVGP